MKRLMASTNVMIVLESGGNGYRGLDAFTLSGELLFHDDNTVTGALVLEGGGGVREHLAATGTHDEASQPRQNLRVRLGTR